VLQLGKRPEDGAVHHVDEDRSNNDISNLAKSGIRQKDLAEQFNVAGPTISNIVTGKTWSHV